jgi:hypothetical protein
LTPEAAFLGQRCLPLRRGLGDNTDDHLQRRFA